MGEVQPDFHAGDEFPGVHAAVMHKRVGTAQASLLRGRLVEGDYFLLSLAGRECGGVEFNHNIGVPVGWNAKSREWV